MKNVHSINLYLRELAHLLVFVVAGFCPWYRPWNWVVILLYVLLRELLWDPVNECGKPWWKLEYGEKFYSWADGCWINFKVKGLLDASVCLNGALIGTVLYTWLLGG